MSLAILASKVFPDVMAFVVDHKFRPESQWESTLVRQRLNQHGIHPPPPRVCPVTFTCLCCFFEYQG